MGNQRLRSATLHSRFCFVVLCAVIATACSTVYPSQERASELTTESGTRERSPSGAAESSDEFASSEKNAGETRTRNRTGSAGLNAGVGQTTSPDGSGGGNSPTTRSIKIGKGVSGGKVRIGIPWLDATKFAAAVAAVGGFDPGDLGDQESQAQAVVDHVNANGGLAGFDVEPVYYEINAAEYASGDEGRAREAQRMCARWTEDTEVFVMLSLGWAHDNLIACAANRRTPMVAAGTSQYLDRERFKQIADYFYVVNGFLVDRRELTLLDSLSRQSFFEPDMKLGLLIEGNFPQFKRAIDRSLKPELAKMGVAVEHEIVYPDFIQSPWQNYVLQFSQRQVTHVYFGGTNGALWAPLFFMRSAEDQQYRPRYALASDHGVNGLSSQAPREQVRRVSGVGWLARNDRGYDRLGGPVSAGDALCREVLAKAGQPESGSTVYCDTLFFLKAALDRASAITPQGLSSSVAGLDDGVSVASVFATRFGVTRHDGADVVHDFAFDNDCGCFNYISGPLAARR